LDHISYKSDAAITSWGGMGKRGHETYLVLCNYALLQLVSNFGKAEPLHGSQVLVDIRLRVQ